MSFKPVGFDGYEYVDDPITQADVKASRIWTEKRMATDDKCQRCGRSYRELVERCANAKLHGERNERS